MSRSGANYRGRATSPDNGNRASGYGSGGRSNGSGAGASPGSDAPALGLAMLGKLAHTFRLFDDEDTSPRVVGGGGGAAAARPAWPAGLRLLHGPSRTHCVAAVYGARGLPKMDTFGSVDGYVRFTLGDQELRTKVKANTYTPEWDQLFCAEVGPRHRSGVAGLVFLVYDSDTFKKDDYIGQVTLPWGDADGRILELPIRGGKEPGHEDGSSQGFLRLQVAPAEAVLADFEQGMALSEAYAEELEQISRTVAARRGGGGGGGGGARGAAGARPGPGAPAAAAAARQAAGGAPRGGRPSGGGRASYGSGRQGAAASRSTNRGYDIEEDLRDTRDKLRMEREQREQLEQSMLLLQGLLNSQEAGGYAGVDIDELLHDVRLAGARKTRALLQMHEYFRTGGAAAAAGARGRGGGGGGGGGRGRAAGTGKAYFLRRGHRAPHRGHGPPLPGGPAAPYYPRSPGARLAAAAALLRQAHLDSRARGGAAAAAAVVRPGAVFVASPKHVLVAVLSAAGLPKMDVFGLCDPYVKVLVGEQEARTAYIRNTVAPTWNQLFNFELWPSYEREYPGVVLEVWDHDDLTPDDFIGKVEIKWDDLTGEDRELIIRGGKTPQHIDGHEVGRLKLQATYARCVERGFQQGAHLTKAHFQHLRALLDEDGGGATGAGAPGAGGAPLALFRASRKHVAFAVYAASDLPKMDTFGSVDCYVRVRLGEQEVRTEYKANTYSPAWDQLFCLELHAAARAQSPEGLAFLFYDHDTFKSDDYIGQVTVAWSAIDGREVELPILGGPAPGATDGTRRGFARLQVAYAQVLGRDFRQGMALTKDHFVELEAVGRGALGGGGGDGPGGGGGGGRGGRGGGPPPLVRPAETVEGVGSGRAAGGRGGGGGGGGPVRRRSSAAGKSYHQMAETLLGVEDGASSPGGGGGGGGGGRGGREGRGRNGTREEKGAEEKKEITAQDVFRPNNKEASPPTKAKPGPDPSDPRLFVPDEDNLMVGLYAANDLPKVDLVGSCDPYVVVRLAGRERARTGYKTDTQHPEWLQLFSLPVPEAAKSRYSGGGLIFEVWDKNAVLKDKYIGKAELQWDEIDGEPIELTVAGGPDPQNVDGTEQGILQLQVVKARENFRDFAQGMVMEQEHFEALTDL